MPFFEVRVPSGAVGAETVEEMEGVEVVFGAGGGEFLREEVGEGEEVDGAAGEGGRDAVGPGVVEGEGFEGVGEVDAVVRWAEAEDGVWGEGVEVRDTEVVEGGDGVGGGIEEEVEVAGGSWVGVEVEGVGADDEEGDVEEGEGGEEVAGVGGKISFRVRFTTACGARNLNFLTQTHPPLPPFSFPRFRMRLRQEVKHSLPSGIWLAAIRMGCRPSARLSGDQEPVPG